MIPIKSAVFCSLASPPVDSRTTRALPLDHHDVHNKFFRRSGTRLPLPDLQTNMEVRLANRTLDAASLTSLLSALYRTNICRLMVMVSS